MRTDPTIASILAAYSTPIIKADWRIDPRGADPEVVALCADSLGIPVLGEEPDATGPVRRRGVKWLEHVRLALLHLVFGHVGFEPVYEVRADGLAHLVALPERLPATITGINVDDDGTLLSVLQAARPGATATGEQPIPADRLLWYVHDREGATWTGRPLIRPCYSDWLLKIDTKRTNAIGIQRFSAGTPVMEPLPGAVVTPAEVAEAQRVASSVRVGVSGGATTPKFRLRIIGVEGTLPDSIATLNYYDQQMARSVLTSLLDLGNTAVGSRALGDNFATLLAASVQSIGDRMAETATQLCERLVDFNWGEDAVVPAVTCGDIGSDPRAIAQSITTLLGAGALTPGPELEAWVRDAYDLPPLPGGMVGFDEPTEEPTPEVVPEPTQSQVTVAAAGGADRNRGNAEELRKAYLHGDIAARIRWGTGGDFGRCVAIAGKHMTTEQAEGYCANRHREATGQWPGKGRVHAAEPREYREATPAEQAAGVDPAAIDEDHDALVALAETAAGAAVAAWVASATTALAAAAAGGLLALARAAIDLAPGDLAESLRSVMGLARRAGVEQALIEAKRAGAPTVAADDVPDTGEDAEWADVLAERGMGAFADAAKRAAQATDPSGIEDAVDDAGRGPWFDAMVHDAINYAMLGGRLQAMQHVIDATPGTRWQIFHSALRDLGTCENCLEHDQTEYPDIAAGLVDFGLGRYRACLGRSRCRCLLAMSPVGKRQFGDRAFFRGQS
ncbi:hypothetical protein [Kineosporia sp. NBRC 101731]|uniref:phage portal protein family protein n=1 Tax=Kineosporia sp. NBRC 101731 TaxID=3032199 RepID=UPI00249FE540|nr:hypothetical protein [Kineosporia sp. NBRC 101731]GLY32119.1 hypothetical protein Kisp02_54840 [Kineosporia sp. NBRC 101731]